MDAKTQAAVANLQAAVKDYPRGTKRHVPHGKGAHEQWGALVPVLAGDVLTACAAVPAAQATAAAKDLQAGCGRLPPDLVVTLCADDVFDLLDLLDPAAKG